MLNWKNVQYANGSGLVNAIRDNNNQITEGNQQIIDSISQFGEDRTKLKTDSFINNLMQYKDQPDKVQGMIADANTDWLDMSRINEARDTANERSDELSMFTSKEAVKQKNAVALAKVKAEVDAAEALAKANKGLTNFDLTKKLTSANKEAGQAPAIFGMFGADTPEYEVRERLRKFFEANGTVGKEADRQRAIIQKDLNFDDSWWDEFHISNGQEIEDATDAELQAILDNYKYKKTTD